MCSGYEFVARVPDVMSLFTDGPIKLTDKVCKVQYQMLPTGGRNVTILPLKMDTDGGFDAASNKPKGEAVYEDCVWVQGRNIANLCVLRPQSKFYKTWQMRTSGIEIVAEMPKEKAAKKRLQ